MAFTIGVVGKKVRAVPKTQEKRDEPQRIWSLDELDDEEDVEPDDGVPEYYC